jgi:hypothetical protein
VTGRGEGLPRARFVVPWLASLVSVSLSGTLAALALVLSAVSQATAAAWPLARAIELTMGQKSGRGVAGASLSFRCR